MKYYLEDLFGCKIKIFYNCGATSRWCEGILIDFNGKFFEIDSFTEGKLFIQITAVSTIIPLNKNCTISDTIKKLDKKELIP